MTGQPLPPKVVLPDPTTKKNRKTDTQKSFLTEALGRDDWTRTSGLFVPNEARYRAALHPEWDAKIIKFPDYCYHFRL